MDLNDVRNWARAVDLKKIDPKRRERVSCYQKMTIDHVDMIDDLSRRKEKLMLDITEYISQLEKIGVKFEEERTEESKPAEKKHSPLLPD